MAGTIPDKISPQAGKPLRVKLGVALVLMAVFPAMIIAAVLSFENINLRYEETRARLADAASAMSEQVDDHLRHNNNGIRQLAQSISRAGGLSAVNIDEWMAEFHYLYPDFLTVLAADHQATIVSGHSLNAGFHEQVLGLSIAERAYYQEPMETGKYYVSNVFLGKGFGNDPIVAISAPIMDRANEPRGIVEGSLDLAIFSTYRYHLATLNVADLLIVDDENRVIYSSAGQKPLVSLSGTGLIQRAAQGGAVFEYLDQEHDNREQLVAQSRLSNGWTVYISLSKSYLNRAVRDQAALTVIALLSAIVIALTFASLISRRITMPIQKLLERVRLFQSTGANRPIEPVEDGPSEIRVLFRDVAHMTHKLCDSQRNLEEVIAQREEEVRQRTRDLEKAMRSAQEANKAKTEFLANMSHEIRTPISGVLGMNELLLDTGLNEDQRRYASTIQNSAETLLALLNDILDLTKLESGQLSLEILEFDLVTLIESAASMLASQAHDKGLEVVVDIDPKVHGRVHGDPTRVRQIVINLLGNAIKFTEKGVVRIGVTMSDHEPLPVRIEVSDTGPGISRDVQEIIFEKFRQADMSVTRRFGGTGLGLTISKTLVHLMGGDIGLDSELGRGSRFWFRLPLHVIPLPIPSLCWSQQDHPVLMVGGIPALHDSLRHYLSHWKIPMQCLNTKELQLRREHSAASLMLLDISTVHRWRQYCSGEYARHVVVLYPLASRPPPLGQVGTQVTMLSKPVKMTELTTVLEDVVGCPSDPNQEREVVAEPSQHEALQGKRVLLVEDQKAIQILARVMLEQLGLQVDLVSDGAEAVHYASKEHYDLILMDMHMPVMGGAEATSRIRALGGVWSEVPIVALTADALKGTRRQCLSIGMNDYLPKPFKKTVFQRKVVSWLQDGYSDEEDAESEDHHALSGDDQR